ncbi:MAG: hypothetical protein ACKO8K_05520, partial [Candidatus Limnocylindrus sp.]
MTMIASSPHELLAALRSSLSLARDGTLTITDAALMRSEGAAIIAWSAAFSADEATVKSAQWLARAAAAA